MNSLLIPSRSRPLCASVLPPGSKSITNRALILAANSSGQTVLENALDAEDTQVMLSALQQLGLSVQHFSAERKIAVQGVRGGFPIKNAEIYVSNSGTTARFLTAMLAFAHGNYRLFGKERMHQRPIADLVEALQQWGANIQYENTNGCLPLMILPRILPQRSIEHSASGYLSTAISGTVSSQFLSALLLAAPLATAEHSVEIRLTGELVSKPYIAMTLKMLQAFGVEPQTGDNFSSFRFAKNTEYRTPQTCRIEPDASAASYFFAAAAIVGGKVTVQGLSRDSLQGDIGFVNALEKMGCNVSWNTDSISVERPPDKPLHGITIDMNEFSDTVQTLAVVALFADEATEITNIEHNRFKETDRIADLATELRRFNAAVEERRDGLKIVPPQHLTTATVETYDDHRMAMSFAVGGLRIPNVVIQNPDCVQKTFPNFFEELSRIE